VLQARRELKSIHGRLTIGISIMQDLLSVVMLALIPIIATWAGGDYGCEGGLVPYFPTTGNVTIRKVGSEIELRRIAGGGRYVFPASSRTYAPACP
jgi:predicted Kef-type K+ transport protein